MFPWVKFRRAKDGVKAHVLLDHDDYMPRYVLIAEARRSDVKMADTFPLNPGSDVMKPIAAPIVGGGMVTSTINVLLLLPILFVMIKERALCCGQLRPRRVE